MTAPTNSFAEAYAKLNKAQKRAVDTVEGPVMVVAGPGTGKTQILTLRIANILRETQANPEDILALTFTNSGVRAMRERLRRYIGDDSYRVGIYTFHSFAEHVLQTYSPYFPAFEARTVVSDLEKAKILEQILGSQDFSKIVSNYDRFSSLRQVMDAISTIKQEGYSPDEFEALIPTWEKELLESEDMFYKVSRGSYKAGDIKPTELKKVENRIAKAREVSTAFKLYQRQLEKENRYDFSDMILTVLEGLREHAALKADLQERFQYVLVDEHQDTNDGQNKLIELLTDAEHLNGRPNLFTVGDEKQSIYRFQGASDKAFAHFKDLYEDVEVIELEDNYRSGSHILTSAHEVIQNSLPSAKSLRSNVNSEVPVSVREFSDYKFELLFITIAIAEKIKSGTAPEEIAVIYRANKHLDEIKRLFQAFGVPYQVQSRDSLLDDPSITMFLELVRVVANPHDSHSLAKLLFADFLDLDSLAVTKTLREYQSHTRTHDFVPLIEYLQKDSRYQVIVQMISDLQRFDKNHTFTETFKELLQQSGYLAKVLSSSDSRSGLRKVEVLFNELRQQAEQTRSYTAADFVSFVEATLAYNLSIEVVATNVGTGVQCMTAHGSKGLEFDHVYLINTASANWEKRRAFPAIALPIQKYTGDTDDERRLFYVALTRAKSKLHISSAKQDWSGKALEPSRFISELGTEGVAQEDVTQFEVEHEEELARFLSESTISDSVLSSEFLAEKFKEENISVTALNNYLECPITYLFRNLIRLPDVYTPALRYGDAMHRALEDFFTESVAAGEILDKQVLLRAYERAAQRAGFTETDLEVFMQQGRQSLGAYYDYYHQEWTVHVSIEEYIRRTLMLDECEVTISGKIDKLEYQKDSLTGPVKIVDYKTGKVFSKKSTRAQKDALIRQIQFYHLLLQGFKEGEITVKEAVLDFIEPTADNEFEKKSLPVTEEDLIELKNTIETMAKEIRDGSFLQKGCHKKDCEACHLWTVIHS